MSFEEYIAFFFGDWSSIRRWTFLEDDVDRLEALNFYIRLFKNPAFLLEVLSREQLEQGFWEIQSPGFDGSVGYLIGDPNLPLALRLECIRATYNLYKYFFSVDILVHSGQMWW